jgi:hypothetical protein
MMMAPTGGRLASPKKQGVQWRRRHRGVRGGVRSAKIVVPLRIRMRPVGYCCIASSITFNALSTSFATPIT